MKKYIYTYIYIFKIPKKSKSEVSKGIHTFFCVKKEKKEKINTLYINFFLSPDYIA